jgi:hypothetical protein
MIKFLFLPAKISNFTPLLLSFSTNKRDFLGIFLFYVRYSTLFQTKVRRSFSFLFETQNGEKVGENCFA